MEGRTSMEGRTLMEKKTPMERMKYEQISHTAGG